MDECSLTIGIFLELLAAYKKSNSLSSWSAAFYALLPKEEPLWFHRALRVCTTCVALLSEHGLCVLCAPFASVFPSCCTCNFGL